MTQTVAEAKAAAKAPCRWCGEVTITVSRSKTPGNFDAFLGAEFLLTSRQPMVDAARLLVGRGADPATPATMRHEGSTQDSFAPMPLGQWATLTYTETERTPLKLSIWRPFPGAAYPQKSGSGA